MASFTMTKEEMDLWELQIQFWRSHLDIAIEDIFVPVRLTRIQHVIARAIGNCMDIKSAASRGFGKTFLGMLCMAALAVLYPGCDQIVTSNTVTQATLMFEKLRQLSNQNRNMANEIKQTNSKSLVSISKVEAKCEWKSGSVCRSIALDSARGQRAKVLWQDESLTVDADQYSAIAEPIKNTTRLNATTYGFKDFPSKSICLTSACDKGNSFYTQFMASLKEMAKGDKMYFTCAFDYQCAVDNGITDADFFERERKRLPESTFQMEYGTVFLGANKDSAFSYNMVDRCRTLKKVETEQPKNAKSKYVMGVDVATSAAAGSDNSVITILKYSPHTDGTYYRKMVYIRSFNGTSVKQLAEEVRKLYHTKFPNIEKIVYDARSSGGDGFDKFCQDEWVDPTTGKEYPPLACDDEPPANSSAIQVLHPFKAVQSLNMEMYTALRVVLEKQRIELPITYRQIQAINLEQEDPSKRTTDKEIAIYLETDALQREMGNVVTKPAKNGGFIVDVARPSSQHKDRYTSIAMANHLIAEWETESIRKAMRGPECVGIADTLD